MRHSAAHYRAILLTLASAAMFGVATPAVKPFLAGMPAALGAGVLYLGMGMALGVTYLLRGRPAPGICRAELPWLFVSLGCGGVIAPALIFWGLAHATATATALLANTEVVFSTLIARFVFGERYSLRLFGGVALIVAGATVLGGGHGGIDWQPALAVVLACAFWGIDNNAMRKVAHADASFVGCAKGMVAGAVNVGIGCLTSSALLFSHAAWCVGLLGALCYGLSFTLYVRGLRVLGAARTSAYYGTAPFAGALVAQCLLGEPFQPSLGWAAALMAVGVWIHVVDPPPPMGPHVVDIPDDPQHGSRDLREPDPNG